MFSQFAQDHYVYARHFRRLTRPGVYADVAAHAPVHISNTFFFDRCLGWQGLCIEANPAFVPQLFRQRGCAVAPVCVADADGEVDFALDGGYSGVFDSNKNKARWKGYNESVPLVRMPCTTTQFAFDRAGVRNVDLLSLDVEGHEMSVLRGIDWRRVHVKVLIVETTKESHDEIVRFLGDRGFVKHKVVYPEGRYRHNDLLFDDAIFYHKTVTWGRPM